MRQKKEKLLIYFCFPSFFLSVRQRQAFPGLEQGVSVEEKAQEGVFLYFRLPN